MCDARLPLSSLTRFEWPCGNHVGCIDLSAGPAPAAGNAQARALAPVLPLLAALEDWLGCTIGCPEPVDRGLEAASPADEEGALLRLALKPSDHSAGCASLLLPWAALPRGRRLSGALLQGLQWPQVEARVELQSLTADRIDADALELGAVLLLPAAFGRSKGTAALSRAATDDPAAWPVRLVASIPEAAATAPLAVMGHWRPGTSQVNVSAPMSGSAPVALLQPAWSVRLQARVAVPLSRWFGDLGAVTMSAVPEEVELWRAGRHVASGRLLAVGAGFGLRIDELCESQTTASTAA